MMQPVAICTQIRRQSVLKSQPGIYALLLSSSGPALIEAGKLGILQLRLGFYVSMGSAHGPGGLLARLAHHLKPHAPAGR
jgi:Uri superfamily endonuclease